MSVMTVFLTVWLLQTSADHFAIVQTASDFARYVKSRDATSMAKCIRLVCKLEHPEWEKEKPGFNKPSHELYAWRMCRHILAFQDCAQTLQRKFDFHYNKPFPRSDGAYPVESDISPWVDAIRNCISSRFAMVDGDRCLEYRIKYGGNVMHQRFVQIQGKWYLGSCPFSDMSAWDHCRNDPATYAISDLAITQLPWHFGQARKMAEEGKSKAEAIKYLQDRHLLPREDIEQTGKTLPAPPK